jgi:MscS family membrane protein
MTSRIATLLSSALLLAGLVLVPVTPALGPPQQEPAGEQAEPPAEPVFVAPDSPRASLERYLELCRAGRWADAAEYLDVAPARAEEAATLALRLKAVLDEHVWFDLQQISPAPEGDLTDGLLGVDQVAVIPHKSARPDPVRVERVVDDAGVRWVFSRPTVARIDDWFGELDNRWAIEHLPPALLKPGFGELLWWQWLALPLFLVLAWLAGWVLGSFTSAALNRLAARTSATWDDVILDRLGGPLALAWGVLVLYLLVPLLGLYEPAEDLIQRVLRVALYVVFFWSLLRSIDVLGGWLLQTPWSVERPASRSLVPLGGRVVKVLIIAMAVVGVLGELGFSVTSLVAGLGIGGLALALAFQKTGENVFGAFALGVDQPFRVGDFVKIEDFVGTVEMIGMRSTRIRTLDRTLISMPNGRLAEMRLETFAARDRLRLSILIGVVYGTTAEQMEQILAGFERVLREHPRIWPDTVVVKFAGFGAYSLDIEIMSWFLTTDYNEFRQFRQEVLLGFMHVVEAAGSSFAFPTQTLHLVGERPIEVTGLSRD